MPFTVRKTRHKTTPYAVINTRTGEVVARSRTKTNATSHARIRTLNSPDAKR